ncbi:hypothetical protein OG372_18435 [Streptomyces sp. NBC_01020]|uniref:hypothetical protein n=1 Tax=unclassified Streptomyces TaxID=2593676 RepID=UPI002E2058FF|nr:hypothetical protein OG372_18435 [Streptomyces sp. NBC_01020]WSX68534.1 hypothetical protein OG221_18925 [Streptomyces sp. NBC_00932]
MTADDGTGRAGSGAEEAAQEAQLRVIGPRMSWLLGGVAVLASAPLRLSLLAFRLARNLHNRLMQHGEW